MPQYVNLFLYLSIPPMPISYRVWVCEDHWARPWPPTQGQLPRILRIESNRILLLSLLLLLYRSRAVYYNTNDILSKAFTPDSGYSGIGYFYCLCSNITTTCDWIILFPLFISTIYKDIYIYTNKHHNSQNIQVDF